MIKVIITFATNAVPCIHKFILYFIKYETRLQNDDEIVRRPNHWNLTLKLGRSSKNSHVASLALETSIKFTNNNVLSIIRLPQKFKKTIFSSDPLIS